MPDTAIYAVFRFIKSTNKRYVDSVRKAQHKSHFNASRINNVLLGVKLDPKLKYYRYDGWSFFSSYSYRTFTITNNSDVVLVAMGINKSNVNDYRYHVLLNDSIDVVPWSIGYTKMAINLFWQTQLTIII